jgi:hypothetical protein
MALLSDLNSKIAIPRNPLYRKREVRIKLQTPLVVALQNGANVLQALELVLTEVTSISQNTDAPTATLLGPIAATIQPWYFGPMILEISGKSYMGAYDNDQLNIAADNDVSKLLTLRSYVNQSFAMAQGSITNLLATLILGDPKRQVLGVDQTLTGFLDGLSIDENQDEQYMQGYRFKFTGEPASKALLDSGDQRATADQKNAHDLTTSGVSVTSSLTSATARL